jgi:hypothetical protein
VSDSDYQYGVTILNDTYTKVKRDNGNYTYADYWNLAVAFSRLKGDTLLIRKYLDKSKSLNPVSFAKIFLEVGGNEKTWEYSLSKDEYTELKDECLKIKNSSPEYYDEQGVNIANAEAHTSANHLESLLDSIKKNDQKYRFDSGNNLVKQRELDKSNLVKIDSLYDHYKTYIGKTIAGEEYSTVMWLVIQHSELAVMERYLPVINKAVKEGELAVTPLKFLLDRIYSIKYKYQFFGSQKGVPLADTDKIEAIRAKYAVNDSTAQVPNKPKLIINKTQPKS